MVFWRIYKSSYYYKWFRKSGISLPLDGSQDDEFKSISINEENEVIEEIVDDINISEKVDL